MFATCLFSQAFIEKEVEPLSIHMTHTSCEWHQILISTLASPAGNQPIEAGNYVLKTQVTADEKSIAFEQSFSITNANARQLNQKCGQSRADDILHVIWDICRNWRDPRSFGDVVDSKADSEKKRRKRPMI